MSLPAMLINKDVKLQFHDPENDWETWTILASITIGDEIWLRLQGRNDGRSKYISGPMWIRLADIALIEEEK